MTVIYNLLKHSAAGLTTILSFGQGPYRDQKDWLYASLYWLKNWGDERGYFERMLWLPVAFAIGCGTYFSLSNEPFPVLYFLILGFTILSGFGLKFIPVLYRGFPEFLHLILMLGVAGVCYSALRTHSMTPVILSAPLEKTMIEGWLTELSASKTGTRLKIKVHAISDTDSRDLPVFVRLTQRKDTELQPGRFVRCFGTLQPPPSPLLSGEYNFRRDAFFERLGAVGFVFGSCKAGVLPAPDRLPQKLIFRINAERRALAAKISSEGGKGGGLAAALLTGDRSFLLSADQNALRNSGLAHLLAISGLHMGLAAGVFYVTFFRALVLVSPLSIRFPVQKLAAFCALIAVTVYLVFSGASISAQRAFVMVATALVAKIFDRPAISFQTLGLAMFIVLLIAPWSAVTPGFQMSFAATGALIAAYKEPLQRNSRASGGLIRKAFNFFGAVLLTSLVAGLATLPFALFHFGRAAPLSLLANCLAMPVISLVCVPFAAITAITLPFGWERPGLYALGKGLEVVIWLAHQFDVQPDIPKPFSLPQMPPLSLFMSVIALTMLVLHRRQLSGLSVIAIFIMATVWGRSPNPGIVYDGAGHIYARSETGWQEVALFSGGLRPLRYADAERIPCKKDCQISLGEEQYLAINRDRQSITLISNQQSYDLDYPAPGDDPYGLVQSKKGFRLLSLGQTSCRPWSV